MPPPGTPAPQGQGQPLGPYEAWMFSIGKRYDLPDLMLEDAAHLSAVAELPQAVAPPAPAASPAPGQPRLPLLWRAAGFKTRFLPVVLGPDASGRSLLSRDQGALRDELARLGPALSAGAGNAAGLRLNFPLRSETVSALPPAAPSPAPRDPALAGRAPKVILAIIDHGIPFAHGAYRQADTLGTRIDWCWSQGAPAQAGGSVLFGREFRRDQIDSLLSRHAGDEEAAYREAGLLSRPDGPPMPLSRLASHGAHCLDLLAGDWPVETAPEARIIAVDLPSSPVWETSGFGKDMFLLSAFHYIFDRADRLRDLYGTPDLPLIINLSYGHSGGAQDGGSLIEAAMAEIVAHRNTRAPTVLVMPSGNTFQADLFAHLTERHFSAAPGPRQASLQWLAPPDDRTSSFLEAWFPPDLTPADLVMAVSPPGGGEIGSTAALAPVAGNVALMPLRLGGRTIGQVSLDRRPAGRWRAMLCLAPTATFAPPASLVVGSEQHGTAPAGQWTLTFRLAPGKALPATLQQGGKPVIGGIQLRIQRDTSYGQGLTGARQSRFLDPEDEPFAPEGHPARGDRAAQGAKLRRFGTLNGMAGGAETLIVSGCYGDQARAADYSAAGFLPPAGPAVHLSAPSETSFALPGLRAAGTRTGMTFRASGTSAASPQVARLLAESLLANPLPPGSGLAQVLTRLRSLPRLRPVADPADWPRMGEIAVQG